MWVSPLVHFGVYFSSYGYLLLSVWVSTLVHIGTYPCSWTPMGCGPLARPLAEVFEASKQLPWRSVIVLQAGRSVGELLCIAA